MISQSDAKKGATLNNLVNHSKRMAALIETLGEAETKWKETLGPALDALKGYDVDADLQGRYRVLLKNIEEKDEEEWRGSATAVISQAISHIIRSTDSSEFISQFSADQMFNLAQISRRLGRNDLEFQLTQAAYEANKSSAAARALFLQSEAKRLDVEGGANTAFDDLLDMVRNLTMDSPHIVLAEAWNGAEHLRKYTELIEAIDSIVARHKKDKSVFLPSYAFIVKGEALQRRGFPGDPGAAVQAYSKGVLRLQLEGLHTQWGEAAIDGIRGSVPLLFLSSVDTFQLDTVVESSGITPLQTMYSALNPTGEANVRDEELNRIRIMNQLIEGVLQDAMRDANRAEKGRNEQAE